MLQLLIRFALGLTTLFSLSGLLIARTWGWQEYASDTLYAVYLQQTSAGAKYWITQADGSSAAETLNWHGTTPTALTCSPDGRTLAFAVGQRQVYAIDAVGIRYEREITNAVTLGISNDAAITVGTAHGVVLVNAERTASLETPSSYDNARYAGYAAVKRASDGYALWSQTNKTGIGFVSPSGVMRRIFAGGSDAIWLASEQFFSYDDLAQATTGRYLVDTSTGIRARVEIGGTLGAFSPDGTLTLNSFPSRLTNRSQIFVGSTFGDAYLPLTSDPTADYAPVCFLTFRPKELIGE